MISSNNPRPSDSGFAVVLAFDYYDGPETGLAVYPSGEGVRFSSVGDSDSRERRAFEMAAIEGDWLPAIKALMHQEGVINPRRLIVPGESKMLSEIKENVMRAASKKLFVAVGSPDFEQLSIVEVSDAKIAAIRELGCSPDGFRLVHQMVTHVDGEI